MRGARWRLIAAKIFAAPAADHRRRHRHQRQDIGRRLHAPDLDRARASRRQHRHDRHRIAARRNLRLADDARSGGAASLARCARRRRRHASCDRSVLAWARSISARWSAHCGGRLHQSSRAIISTIIRPSRLISPPSCGCLRNWSRRAARRSSMSITNMPMRWSPPPRRAACGSSPSAATATAFASSIPRWTDFAQRLRIDHAGKDFHVRLPLVGEFQVENALVAAGLAIATGGDPAAVFPALEHLVGAKGRLELVGVNNGAPIFIDYAHKPDALAKALDALRPAATRQACRGVRRRRRPRPRQAAVDGRRSRPPRPTG